VHGNPWRDLRLRVALLTTLVAVASVSAMAWYAGRVSASAWRRQLAPTPVATLSAIARAVAKAVGPGAPDWARAQHALDDGAKETGKQLIVFDSTRRAVASAPPELKRLDVTLGADGSVSWQRVVANEAVALDSSNGRRAIVRQRAMVGNPQRVPIVRGAGDASAGTLVEIAAPLSLDAVGDPLIVGMLRRPLLVGLGVAIVGAMLVAAAFSARLGRPIEQRTVAELRRQEALRRGMTSDIAHELRTPLTNIRCQLESMLDGLEQPSASTLTSLHEECLGLQQLIDDLQDMAYGDQGQLVLSPEQIDVRSELTAAARSFQQRASGAGTEIRVEAPEDLQVSADRRRFRQIVANLVSNALAHTSNGVVAVTASDNSGVVAVEVRDTGSGIPAADLPNVFERFYRADPARARSGGGAGLGLAIVKQLVELHGGAVSIASRVERGTTVRFTLPRSQPRAAP
jgi:signal transduction histidine kinase